MKIEPLHVRVNSEAFYNELWQLEKEKVELELALKKTNERLSKLNEQYKRYIYQSNQNKHQKTP